MKYLEMTDEDHRFQEERRAVPPARRAGARAAVAAGGVLVTAVLGWSTAAGIGLTASAEHVPDALVGTAPSADTDWAEPAMRRTVDLTPPRARPTTPPPTRTPAVPSGAVPRVLDQAPGPAARPDPSPAPARAAAVPVVRKGDACPGQGATGVTRSGTSMTCVASPGNGRLRWRSA